MAFHRARVLPDQRSGLDDTQRGWTVLETLPAFMVLARMGVNRHAERFYLVPAIAVQGVLLLAFYNGAWLS